MNSKRRKQMEMEMAEENARAQARGDLFNALPDCHQKAALLDAMTVRVIELFNEAKFEQGDGVLEFMPNGRAKAILEWYFDESAPNEMPDFSALEENESVEQLVILPAMS